MSRKKVRQKHSIKIANRSFEGVAKFKYLGTTLTDHNCRQEEIKNRLNSGNASYLSVQSLLSSRLLSRNVKVKQLVLYECETWSHTLREEHRLMVFENRVLGRIFGQKREEVTGEWRKLHREELHILYSSPHIVRQIKSRRLRWEGHVVCMGEERNVYKVLMGKPEGKRPFGRLRSMW
jgi:3-deoxy-D-manno-octulosonic-acid transferase